VIHNLFSKVDVYTRVGGQLLPAPCIRGAGKVNPTPENGLLGPTLSHRMYVLSSFRKTTPPQKRQLIVDYHFQKYEVDRLVGELTF